MVFKTDPAVGTVVRKGTGVTVWVSDGPGRVQLPENLLDLPLGTVRKFLGDVGLVQDEKAVPSDEPAGQLVSVTPEPGTWVDHGARVTLEVSCGDEDRC
jgi:serine/threonine-protein kinase